MGCICGTDSKVNKKPPNKQNKISSQIPKRLDTTSTYRGPPKAVGSYNSYQVNLQYPDSRNHSALQPQVRLRHTDGFCRYPNLDNHNNHRKVEVESIFKEFDISLELASLYYLDSKYRDPSRDCDYSETINDCPYGWKLIGIKTDQRETDDWAITYHGTKSHLFNTICREGYKVGPRAAFGRGVYSSPNIEVASGFAQSFTFSGATYVGVLQNRVNTKCTNIKNDGKYWVCPDPANIIPCGLCVKKVDPGYPY